MKIIAVIVDELPKSCTDCQFLEMPNFYNCLILDIGTLPEGEFHRHPDCPLRLEHDNKKEEE